MLQREARLAALSRLDIAILDRMALQLNQERLAGEIPLDGSWRWCRLHGATVGMAWLRLPAPAARTGRNLPVELERPLRQITVKAITDHDASATLSAELPEDLSRLRDTTAKSLTWFVEAPAAAMKLAC